MLDCDQLQMTRILDVQTKDLQIFMGRVVRQNERFLFTFQDVS